MDSKTKTQPETAGVSRRTVLRGMLGVAAIPLLQAGQQPPAGAAAAQASPAAKTMAAAAVKKPIVLRWQTNVFPENQFEPIWKEIIRRYEAENPNVKIEPIIVARKDHWTKFVTAAKANQAPDVVQIDIVTAAYHGYLRPIDDFWKAEPESFRQAWSKSTLDITSWQGKLYGLPSWGGAYGEYYNKDLVKQAGLDISKPPATWDEYLSWAKKLTIDKERWALAILGGKTDTTARILLMWIWSNGGEAFNKDMTVATFASNPKALEAIEFYLGLELNHKVAAPGTVNINYLEQSTLFAQEKIATMRAGYWAYAKVMGDNPAMKDKLAIAFPPMNTPNKITLLQTINDGISKDAKDPEAAWKFIKFVNDREWAAKRAKIANWVPLRVDLANEPELRADPVLQQFLKYGTMGRGYPLPHPLWNVIGENDIPNAIQAAVLRKGSVKEVFSKLDEDLARKFKNL